MHFAANHRLFVDFSLESYQGANIQSSISTSSSPSRLCVLKGSSLCPHCVLGRSSRYHHVLSQHHQASVIHCPLFVKSRPERNSSILTVSSSYHRCIAYWPSPCCQNIFRASSPCCQNNFRTSSLYGHRFITASSRPLNPLSDPCQSYLHAQLKRCQDITSQSLVYHGLLVSNHCYAISSLHHVTSTSPMSRQSVLGVSPIHYLCVLQHHVSAAIVSPVCHRLLVEASTRSRNLVKPRQNTVRALSEHCQSTPRESSTPSHVSPSRPQRVL